MEMMGEEGRVLPPMCGIWRFCLPHSQYARLVRILPKTWHPCQTHSPGSAYLGPLHIPDAVLG